MESTASPPAPSVSSDGNATDTPIPAALQGEVDPAMWGRLTEFDKLTAPTEQQVNGHIGFIIQCWYQKGLTAQTLWSKFAEEFGDWEKDNWAKVPT